MLLLKVCLCLLNTSILHHYTINDDYVHSIIFTALYFQILEYQLVLHIDIYVVCVNLLMFSLYLLIIPDYSKIIPHYSPIIPEYHLLSKFPKLLPHNSLKPTNRQMVGPLKLQGYFIKLMLFTKWQPIFVRWDDCSDGRFIQCGQQKFQEQIIMHHEISYSK